MKDGLTRMKQSVFWGQQIETDSLFSGGDFKNQTNLSKCKIGIWRKKGREVKTAIGSTIPWKINSSVLSDNYETVKMVFRLPDFLSRYSVSRISRVTVTVVQRLPSNP